jgi:hypothetical protein
METYNVEFRHGHFFDLKTKKRLIPIQGEKYTIVAEPAPFTQEDAKLKINPPLQDWC